MRRNIFTGYIIGNRQPTPLLQSNTTTQCHLHITPPCAWLWPWTSTLHWATIMVYHFYIITDWVIHNTFRNTYKCILDWVIHDTNVLQINQYAIHSRLLQISQSIIRTSFFNTIVDLNHYLSNSFWFIGVLTVLHSSIWNFFNISFAYFFGRWTHHSHFV